MGGLLMAGAQGLRDGVEGVHDDEEVDDERDEAGDQRPHHVAAVGPHLPADGQPPGVRVAVPPDVRYRAGGRHRADENHPDDLRAFHGQPQENRMRMTMQLHELGELALEAIKVCAAYHVAQEHQSGGGAPRPHEEDEQAVGESHCECHHEESACDRTHCHDL